MQFLTTLKMSSDEFKKNLEYINICVGSIHDFEVYQYGTGFFLKLSVNKEKTSLFFVTAKKNVYDFKQDLMFKKIILKLHTIDILNHSISETPSEFEIDLSKQIIYFDDQIAVYDCTNYINQINNQLYTNHKVLYFMAIDALNLIVDPKQMPDFYETLDFQLFSEVSTSGFLDIDNEYNSVDLAIKKGSISSLIHKTVNNQPIVLVDNNLVKLTYGSICFKLFDEDAPINLSVLGLLVGYQSIDINIEDKVLSYPNGYAKIYKGYEIINFIFNKVLNN